MQISEKLGKLLLKELGKVEEDSPFTYLDGSNVRAKFDEIEFTLPTSDGSQLYVMFKYKGQEIMRMGMFGRAYPGETVTMSGMDGTVEGTISNV